MRNSKYINQIDEVRLIEKYCEIIVCDNRTDGIKMAIKNKFNIIILDDGYQDFSIKKKIGKLKNFNKKISYSRQLF